MLETPTFNSSAIQLSWHAFKITSIKACFYGGHNILPALSVCRRLHLRISSVSRISHAQLLLDSNFIFLIFTGHFTYSDMVHLAFISKFPEQLSELNQFSNASSSWQYSHLQQLLALDSQRCLQKDQRCVRSRGRICLVHQALLQHQKAALWAFGGTQQAQERAQSCKSIWYKKAGIDIQQPEKLAQCNPTPKVSLGFPGQHNPWFSMPSMQATTTHLWLHSVTVQLEAVPVCSSPALIPVFELWKIHFLFAYPVERKKAIYTHV